MPIRRRWNGCFATLLSAIIPITRTLAIAPVSTRSWRPTTRCASRANARSTMSSIKIIRACAGNWSRRPATIEVSNGISRIRTSCLSILYVRRRHNISDPGLGNHTLERLLSCPVEHLEFHLWYLKEKGWIRATDNGMFTITVEGVDRVNSEQHRKITNKLLTDQRHASKTDGDERRSDAGRRSSKDRRSGLDTRSDEEKAVVGERRRSGFDRRSPSDRRSESRTAKETIGRE